MEGVRLVGGLLQDALARHDDGVGGEHEITLHAQGLGLRQPLGVGDGLLAGDAHLRHPRWNDGARNAKHLEQLPAGGATRRRAPGAGSRGGTPFEDQGHGTVIDEGDLHVGAEAAGGDGQAEARAGRP